MVDEGSPSLLTVFVRRIRANGHRAETVYSDRDPMVEVVTVEEADKLRRRPRVHFQPMVAGLVKLPTHDKLHHPLHRGGVQFGDVDQPLAGVPVRDGVVEGGAAKA